MMTESFFLCSNEHLYLYDVLERSHNVFQFFFYLYFFFFSLSYVTHRLGAKE